MLVLHIQGSGRLMLTEADGRQRMIRVAYAGTNDQPYKSVGRWLLDQNLVRDATWPGISAWIAANPSRVNEMLWSNPRYVFFREEALNDFDAQFGPKGAQGVALTPGRSIAVDRNSIPYGTPVWLSTPGPTVSLNRLVFAQDTGSAILGAVRADYFMGWGPRPAMWRAASSSRSSSGPSGPRPWPDRRRICADKNRSCQRLSVNEFQWITI
jgi:membrane-bound lytic murein transglycosylase A